MSVSHCQISGYEKELKVGQGLIKGVNIGVIKKTFRYQLGSGDVNHIMEMSEIYKKNQDLCVTDVTSKIQYRKLLQNRWKACVNQGH
ncbi:1-phosphatidylinositol-4-phosphate 5-kinase [Oxytricha trifallax]|uniref:1-phosphatidylinositol-4-phosphate 5-kinase n=1 Tax=Oxytricha trifallax TaxID=1172189 RepID=A0A073HZ70_9SPIT|nr:1-phosphatidylinositol-4-phosphate 5-kinase [Oxytricha trifallax]